MDDRNVDMALLGAYVDGELDDETRLSVAEAIANDPDLAHRVMLLSRLKSTISVAVDAPDIELPRSRTFRKARRMMVAACVVAGFLMGGFYFYEQHISPVNEESLLAQAHGSWLSGEDVAKSAMYLVRASTVLANAHIPDLTPSRLKMAHAAITPLDGRERMVIGYKGDRGCRLTFMISGNSMEQDADLAHTPRTELRNGLLRAKWRVGALDYALISTGMPRIRFDLIASSVADATVRHAPFEVEIRTALSESRAKSKPCAA